MVNVASATIDPASHGADIVTYGTQVTALNAVALNGAEATRTSAAIDVRGWEYLRLEYYIALDGTGMAAGNSLTLTFLGSQDNGSTFRPVMKLASDDTISRFAPQYELIGGDITATYADGDLGPMQVAGLTHIKIIGTGSGSPDGDNKLTVKVRPARE